MRYIPKCGISKSVRDVFQHVQDLQLHMDATKGGGLQFYKPETVWLQKKNDGGKLLLIWKVSKYVSAFPYEIRLRKAISFWDCMVVLAHLFHKDHIPWNQMQWIIHFGTMSVENPQWLWNTATLHQTTLLTLALLKEFKWI